VRWLLTAVRDVADDRGGIGVVLVEPVMRIADRCILLERGRVVLVGPTAEVAGRLDQVQSTCRASASAEDPILVNRYADA
jgi:ABC-type branched-subunit amino acid transport system ATPase component